MNVNILVSPEKREHDAVLDALIAYNNAQVGPSGKTEITFHVRSESGDLVAGANGFTHWNYFFLAHLWVADTHRGAGVGGKLLRAIEHEAQQRKCDHLWLDTFDWQAAGFYEKMGYSRFGKLDNYPTGHERYFYSKKLTAL